MVKLAAPTISPPDDIESSISQWKAQHPIFTEIQAQLHNLVKFFGIKEPPPSPSGSELTQLSAEKHLRQLPFLD